MRPYDAIFVSCAFGLLAKMPRHWQFVAVVPLICQSLAALPLGRFYGPLAAMIACAIGREYASVALLLSAPSYESLFHAVLYSLLWLGVRYLTESLRERCESELLPMSMRGLASHLFCLAILYYTLLPVSYL